MSKNKKITFQRKVNVQTWDLRLSLQKYDAHPVWLAILKLAKENSGRVSAKMFREKLLVNKLTDLQAKILLNRVVLEGLLDKNYHITTEGKDALDKNLIPFQMSGMFTTSFVDDVLIPQVVLSVSEPHESRVDGKSLKRNGQAKKEIEKAREVPEFIKNTIDIPILVNKGAEPVVIKEVEEYGTSLEVTQTILVLQITSSNQISLRLENPVDRRFTLPEYLNLTYTDAIDTLLSSLGNNWVREKEMVHVGFDETELTERRNFQKSFTIAKPNVPGFGEFESVTTPLVKIEPKTLVDAQTWYDWLLIDQLPNKYLQESMFQKHVSKVGKKFSDNLLLDIPDQERLAQDLFQSGDAAKSWLLRAPLDLSLGDVK